MNVVSTVIFNDLTIDMECLAFSFTTPYPFASNRLPRNPRECQSRVLHFSLGCCIVYIGEANVIERGWDGEIENRNVAHCGISPLKGKVYFYFCPKLKFFRGIWGAQRSRLGTTAAIASFWHQCQDHGGNSGTKANTRANSGCTLQPIDPIHLTSSSSE